MNIYQRSILRKLSSKVRLAYGTRAYKIMKALYKKPSSSEELRRVCANPKGALFELLDADYIVKLKDDYYELTEEGIAALQVAEERLSKDFAIEKACTKALQKLTRLIKSWSSIEDFVNYLVGLGGTVEHIGDGNVIKILIKLQGDSVLSLISEPVHKKYGFKKWRASFHFYTYIQHLITGYKDKQAQAPESKYVWDLKEALDNLIDLTRSQHYCSNFSEYKFQDVEIEVEEYESYLDESTPMYKELGDDGDYYYSDELKFID